MIFGPHGFHSQGLIHTIIRVQDPCQTTAQTFKLFFDNSLVTKTFDDQYRVTEEATRIFMVT